MQDCSLSILIHFPKERLTPMKTETNIGTRQKALKINLDRRIYGSFAEIGAGQEVAAMFFKAGGASGTIAKTISAYDMTFSDAIYGAEESGRYVVEPRLIKMLSREYNLLQVRLGEKRGADTMFFAFANTVVALNYQKTNEGHGWIGLRFQLEPQGEYNDIVMHIKMIDNDSILQQQAVGIIGVNLIYGAFYFHKAPDTLLDSLMDELDGRMEIDMLRFSGPVFSHIDNRLIALQLVRKGFTNAAMFGPDGHVLQPSELLYKKHIVAIRGRFRPFTLVNMDMLNNGVEQFLHEADVDPKRVLILSELTLHNLKDGDEIDEKDFLDRVDILASLGQTVLISNYQEYYRLVAYLSRFTKLKIGLILGMPNLEWIFEESYYHNLQGGILEAFASLFSKNVKLFIYPTHKAEEDKLVNCEAFHWHLPSTQIDLFEYLLANNKIEDIRDFNKNLLHITSDQVLALIKEGKSGWEDKVPPTVARLIKEKSLFGFPKESNYAPLGEQVKQLAKENQLES
jgi:hypothetical protein